MIAHGDTPFVVAGDHLRRWTPAGYRERMPRGPDDVDVLTPPSLVEVLRPGRDGAVPLLHPSAG